MILVGKPVPAFPGSCCHLTPQRPSQPAPRSVTIARTSLMVARAGRIIASDLPDDARGNFVFNELVKTEVAAELEFRPRLGARRPAEAARRARLSGNFMQRRPGHHGQSPQR